jgi:hypothetical protein
MRGHFGNHRHRRGPVIVPCPGQIHPERNEHASTESLKRANEALGRAQPGRRGMRHLDRDRIRHAEHRIGDHPENKDLRPDRKRGRRVRELRQEREAEERRLGVRGLHDDAVAQGLARRWCGLLGR